MLVLKDIDELITLQAAAQKKGRHVHERDLSVIKKGAIVIHGERILWIGPTSQLPKEYKKAKSRSLKGSSVLPAFVECHTHLVFAGSRANELEMRVQGRTYQDIAEEGGGIRSTVAATRKATPADLLKLAKGRVDRFVEQGVTTIESKSGYGLSLKDETKILAVNKNLQKSLKSARIISTFLGPHAVPPDFNSAGDYMEFIREKILPEIAKKKLASRVDAFVEEGYFSPDISRPYYEEAKKLGLEVVVHADQLTNSGGAQLAVDLNAVSADHLVQIDVGDIERLAKSEVTAVLLPASDLYLRMKYPPARQLLEAGARVAIATDFNPGSSPTQEISLVGLLARLEMRMNLAEVIVAYTLNAAWALNLQDEVGSLEVGKAADFLVVNGSYKELFYQIGPQPIEQVWHRGALVKTKSRASTSNWSRD